MVYCVNLNDNTPPVEFASQILCAMRTQKYKTHENQTCTEEDEEDEEDEEEEGVYLR